MRGKLPADVKHLKIFRNIPAYAGKTAEKEYFAESMEEHPRVCGENAIEFAEFLGIHGTSPRMRGKRGCF